MNKTEKITISKGNAKLGAIPSVSLPACITCNPDAPCFKKCYALKLSKRRANVRDSYAHNLEVLNHNPALYWLQVRAAASLSRYFRYHVSGDLPNAAYFEEMIKTARELPNTNFLAFTKQHNIINEYINNGGEIPANLKIIYSNWGTWKCENPHNLPACEVVFKGSEPDPAWKVCGGNCTECACRGVGCWELKRGEVIAIYEH